MSAEIAIRCYASDCGHRFERTAAQVLADQTCPKCASTDIDVDLEATGSAQKPTDVGEPSKEECPRCGTAQFNPTAKICSQCGYTPSDDPTEQKKASMLRSVMASNPGLSTTAAQSLVDATVRRFPGVIGSR